MSLPLYQPLRADEVSMAALPWAQPHSDPPTERPTRAQSILDLVGHTPLVEITRVCNGVAPRVRVLAKLEGFNPGGSVKDRPAIWMVRDGLRRGELCPGKTIIESTSGNTGIALALAGAVLGYPVELVMPANVST